MTEAARQGRTVALACSQSASSSGRAISDRGRPLSRARRSTSRKRPLNRSTMVRSASSGIDLQEPRDVHRGEENIAELAFQLLRIAAGERFAQLGDFLIELGQHVIEDRPLEADLHDAL